MEASETDPTKELLAHLASDPVQQAAKATLLERLSGATWVKCRGCDAAHVVDSLGVEIGVHRHGSHRPFDPKNCTRACGIPRENGTLSTITEIEFDWLDRLRILLGRKVIVRAHTTVETPILKAGPTEVSIYVGTVFPRRSRPDELAKDCT